MKFTDQEIEIIQEMVGFTDTYITTKGVDTIETIVYDTTYIEGYYDYRAIANEGYQFAYWEVTTTYNKWY